MHGNLDAPQLNRDASPPGLALWFGTPAAQDYFDPASLTEADRVRLTARRNPRRRQEFKVSRALQGFALGGAAQSLSHSGGHAALLIASSKQPIGVDLEVIRPRDVLRIARFSFSQAEVAALEASPARLRDELFYTLWTMKEALAKALRLELVDALRQCVFAPAGSIWPGSAPTRAPWSVQVFQPQAGFLLAAACVGSDTPPSLQMWQWPPLLAANWLPTVCATAPAGAAALPA